MSFSLNDKEIRIINNTEFEKTINSKKRIKRIFEGLKKDLEVYNSQFAVNYSDEGYACFEIIMNKNKLAIISFVGTAM